MGKTIATNDRISVGGRSAVMSNIQKNAIRRLFSITCGVSTPSLTRSVIARGNSKSIPSKAAVMNIWDRN